ncbi:VOC family protein [Gillisia sp. M10.2A]|uniref:VOC family protein n=1 Tax=Gillisia lutea TaxID=2909668 RepID=A0ABS9EDG5_9FLAO|nr:VOC family protein [Gillisia lutea]MCF4100924.1 VOC family protein [Gillisia lutea]
MKIERLEIGAGNIRDQLKFYRDLLGFEIQNYKESSFEIQTGYSVLKFVENQDFTPYHIAFHIPDKQEEKALNWLKDNVQILKNNNQEIINFSNWNAKSIYFYDADKNIVEFISRRNSNKPSSAIFSGESILGISEIGLATSNIKEKFEILETAGLEQYDGNFEEFCAIGDDEGLIITINKNLKSWFPTGDSAYSSNFSIEFNHRGKAYNFLFEEDQLKQIN